MVRAVFVGAMVTAMVVGLCGVAVATEPPSMEGPADNLAYPDAAPADWWHVTAPTENVTASKVRLWSYPKDGKVIQGYHAWLYEFEVSMLALGGGLISLGSVCWRRKG